MNQENLAVHMLNRLDNKVITEAIRVLCEEQSKPNSRGGMLAIGIISHNICLVDFASISIGMPGGKFGHLALKTAEKIARLYDLRMEGSDHVAASQSADEDAGSDEGCVFFHGKLGDIYAQIYISFAGAPEGVNEAIVFVIGERLGLISPDYLNPLLERTRELLANVVA